MYMIAIHTQGVYKQDIYSSIMSYTTCGCCMCVSYSSKEGIPQSVWNPIHCELWPFTIITSVTVGIMLISYMHTYHRCMYAKCVIDS